MKFKLILLVSLFGIANIWSQQSLSGTVIDAVTSNPIENVHVYTKKYNIGTSTNSSGVFSFNSIPNGVQSFIISRIGYKTQVVQLSDEGTLKISLAPSVFEMDEVILSTPFHNLLTQNVSPVDRLESEALFLSGAPTLGESIASINGVNTTSTGNSIGKPVIRGLSGNRVVVYHQGVRLENQQFGEEHGLALGSAGVSSVEVIKGPASLLYGSDAIGGVLYINPEKFPFVGDMNNSIDASYNTNTEGFSFSAGHAQSKESWKYLARIGSENHADYKTGDDERVTNTRYRSLTFNSGIGFQKDNYLAEIRYSLNQQKLGIPEEIGDQNLSKTIMTPYQEVDHHTVSLKQDFETGIGFWETVLGYSVNDRKEFEEHHDDHDDDDDDDHEDEEDNEGEEEAAISLKLETFSYDIRNNISTNSDWEHIVGFQGIIQKNTNKGEEILIPDADVFDFGAMWVSHLHKDAVDFQFGIRYDSRNIDAQGYSVEHEGEDPVIVNPLNESFNNFNASVGAQFYISDLLTIKSNIASGFRAPNLSELTSNGIHHGTNRYELGNPNLSAEQNIQFDLGFQYNLQTLTFQGDVFYNTVNDYIFINPTGEIEDGADVYEYSQTDANLYGGEFKLHYHPIGKIHFLSDLEMVVGTQNDDQDLPLIPATQWKNEIRYNFNNNLSVFLRGKFVFEQDKVAFNEDSTDGYTLFDAGVVLNTNTKGITASLVVTNIEDRSYISHLSRLKSDDIENMGRNIVFRISKSF